ncbi:hypothetical protein DERP_001583 [Dermatophagoides pteronyssinus]|uniref:Uncharacterized protein n=1 Tax=Dermatophagoides pteronyssinus TaxID=6956 RepID=A0ABQ8JAX3_DERPT|nr:hypothetical protein DERP_001583 [Dermatophagoides pteronyssinus]
MYYGKIKLMDCCKFCNDDDDDDGSFLFASTNCFLSIFDTVSLLLLLNDWRFLVDLIGSSSSSSSSIQ